MQLIKKLFYIPLSLFLGFFYFVVFVVEGMQTLNDSVHEANVAENHLTLQHT
jgi:hypothetical protein